MNYYLLNSGLSQIVNGNEQTVKMVIGSAKEIQNEISGHWERLYSYDHFDSEFEKKNCRIEKLEKAILDLASLHDTLDGSMKDARTETNAMIVHGDLISEIRKMESTKLINQ